VTPASAKKISPGRKRKKKRRRGFKCEWGRRRNRKKTTFSNRQNHPIFRPPLTAVTKDINLVANESGNSPEMIRKYYLDLATPEQAAAWFAL